MNRYRGYGERAWVALHSMRDRKPDGGPLPFDQITRRSALLRKGEINRFVFGEFPEPSWRVARGVAEALGVELDWLMREEGEGPARSTDLGTIPPWPGPRPSAPSKKGRHSRVESETRRRQPGKAS